MNASSAKPGDADHTRSSDCPPPAFSTPPLAFSTLGCPDWPWDEILRRGIEYGYDGVEVRQVARQTDLLIVPAFRPSQLPQRRKELHENNWRVCGLSSSVRFDHPDASQRESDLRTGEAYLELAAELEARFVRVFGDVLPDASANRAERGAAIDRIADGMNRLGEKAQAWGVDVLIETHGDFASTANMVELMSRIERREVGVLWDTHHPWRFFDEPPADTFARLQPWMRHTHWKDSVSQPRPRRNGEDPAAAAEQAHALMSGHRHADYVLFGGGEFPMHECARILRDAGSTAWLCLEWEKMWHPGIEEPEVALRIFPEKMRRAWRDS